MGWYYRRIVNKRFPPSTQSELRGAAIAQGDVEAGQHDPDVRRERTVKRLAKRARNCPGLRRGPVGSSGRICGSSVASSQILIDTARCDRFQGVGGFHRAQRPVEGRTHCAASGARGAPCRAGGTACRTGTPAWAEQRQQRQAAVQRRAGEAGPGQQPARGVGQEARRAAGPSGRDVAPDGNAGRHDRSLPSGLRRMRGAVDRGAGHRPRRPPGACPGRSSERPYSLEFKSTIRRRPRIPGGLRCPVRPPRPS